MATILATRRLHLSNSLSQFILYSTVEETMWIDLWLFKEKTTHTAFAKKIGISRFYLSLIISRRRIPSLRLAKKIESATNGNVKAVDIMFGNQVPKKKKNQNQRVID